MTKNINEDIKFLSLIVSELRRQVDSSVAEFDCDLTARWIEDDDGNIITDNPFRGASKDVQITWRPVKNKNHPYKHIDFLSLRWWFASDEVSFSIDCNIPGQPSPQTMRQQNANNMFIKKHGECNSHYTLAGEDKGLVFAVKKDFLYIYKKIKQWQDVERPRLAREELINTVCAAFPGVLDSLMMEIHSEKA